MKYLAARLIICIGVSLLAPKAAGHFGWGLTVLAAASFWAALFSHYLLGLIPFIKRSAETSVLERWQGCYYEFRGVQIRFFLFEGIVWVAERDIRRLIFPTISERERFMLRDQHAIIPGHSIKGLSEAGMMRLMEIRTSHRRADPGMIKFKLWLESEAYPNVKRLPTSAVPPR